MFALILPASKIGQLMVGPMDQNRLPPLNQSLALMLCKPWEPVSENFGKRSAMAAMTRLSHRTSHDQYAGLVCLPLTPQFR
jgi:hypothetical protein